MRYLVLVFGLIGVLGAGFTGMIRQQQIDRDVRPAMEMAKLFGADNPKFVEAQGLYQKLVSSTYALLGGAVLGVVACVLILMRKSIPAGVLFLVAYLMPLLFLQEKVTALFPVGLLLAGILSFFVRSPRLMTPAFDTPGTGV